MKRAIITGITGQDGIFLTDLLVKKNYTILGLTSSLNSPKSKFFQELYPFVKIEEFSVNDILGLKNKIKSFKPGEIYNLASISSVYLAEKIPSVTHQVNTILPKNIIKILYDLNMHEDTKFYQASSSEMFGNSTDLVQNENSLFNPISKYAKSKLEAHNYCLEQRNKGLFIACGILFNHESEYRPAKFVSKKICRGIAEIALGRSEKIVLGDLTPSRDWGYAGDYVQAMWRMMQQELAGDYVIASGKSRSIENFVQSALEIAGLKGDVSDFVTQDNKYFRKFDIKSSTGDASKARALLDWTPSTSFQSMIEKMIYFEIKMITAP
jgi:GDPmannose 4,6-dehydratase